MNHLSTITKHNNLVEASYRLSLVGQRVFLLAIAKINTREKLLKQYEITAEEYAREYKISPKIAYRDLKKGLDELYNADIRLNDMELKILTRRRIVDEAKYHYGEGKIAISFPEKLEPFLCELHGQYTQYRIGQVSCLRSAHSIRLYELLIQFRKTTRERLITIAELRDWFRLKKKYTQYGDLNKWVIKPSVDELNTKTNLLIKYECLKKGRRADRLLFSFNETEL